MRSIKEDPPLSSQPPFRLRKIRRLLIVGGCILFLAIQVSVPIVQWWDSPFIHKIGWQMYSRPAKEHSVVILFPDGRRQPVDPLKYFGILREDTDYLPVLIAHLKKNLSPGVRVVFE